MLGEHTDEVLAGLGLAPEAVADLRAQGVVG
jgi:crotonobetainyl-CoA:carnitine CoA-transferase CaiB-like acyl-CoA transferase